MKATLVIAEEPSPSRDTLERFFTRCGFRVITAADGLDCLARLRDCEPEVLVADSELPWGGAAAVVAYLNESHYEFVLPAIFVIGDAPAEILAERTGMPDSCCFEKPVQTERLLDQVGLVAALLDLRGEGEIRREEAVVGVRSDAAACLV